MSVGDLGQAVEDRRFDLNLSQEALVDRGGPSHQIVRNIEKGQDSDYRPTTFRKLDRALRWAPGSAQRLVDTGMPPTEAFDDTAEDWDGLARAVKARRTQLRMRQRDVENRGGLSDRTVRSLETAARTSYSPSTLVQLEQALEWSPGFVSKILDRYVTDDELKTWTGSERFALPPVTPSDDDDVALRIGRVVLALVRAEEAGR